MKRGIFSLICYILYTLAGVGLLIYSKIEIDRINASGGGLEGIAAAILLIVGIAVGVVGVAGLLFKSLHLGTGWGIFGFVCILVDLIVIFALISGMFEGGKFEFNSLGAIVSVISAISMVSNCRSLKR